VKETFCLHLILTTTLIDSERRRQDDRRGLVVKRGPR